MAVASITNGIAALGSPSETLYCSNLTDKLPKTELRRALYMLMITYGPVLDVVALKTMKMRGQAHVTFRDKDASTQAMRALQNFEFFGKPMRIAYARTKSDTLAKLDGTYKQPEVSNQTTAQQAVFGGVPLNGTSSLPAPAIAPAPGAAAQEPRGSKRTREESGDEKEEDEDDAPMDLDDAPMDESDDD